MKRMTVLALSNDRNGLLFVLIEFSARGTDLHYTHSAGDAAAFLSRHPGALILCDRLARDTFASGPLARAVEVGRPCAVVWIDDHGPQRLGIEIERCGDTAAARRLLGNPSLLQKIHLAWRYCKECSLESGLTAMEDRRSLPV